MLKKNLYINFSNLILQKSRFFVFQSNFLNNKFFDNNNSYNLIGLSLKFLNPNVTRFKLPLRLKVFSKTNDFFDFLNQKLIVLIAYKNFLLINEIITILFFTNFNKNLYFLIQPLFKVNYNFVIRFSNNLKCYH